VSPLQRMKTAAETPAEAPEGDGEEGEAAEDGSKSDGEDGAEPLKKGSQEW